MELPMLNGKTLHLFGLEVLTLWDLWVGCRVLFFPSLYSEFLSGTLNLLQTKTTGFRWML